jgi:hypothetical protein
LEADSKLPSIVTLVVGKPVKGSWWGHAKGNLIYNTCGLLDDENDVLCLKLIHGKRTYVHRRYWNLISNLVQSNRTYLEKLLSSESKKILKTVEKNGSLRSDRSGAKTYSLIKPFVPQGRSAEPQEGLAPPILPNLQRRRRFGDEFRNDIGLRKHRHMRAFQHESLGTHSARGIALDTGRNGLV